MRLSSTLLNAFTFLLGPSVIATFVLYLYPALFGCAFPQSTESSGSCYSQNASIAPFKLLVFGDPQLEGDTSLPKPSDARFPSLQRLWDIDSGTDAHANVDIIRAVMSDIFQHDLPLLLWSYRKRLDLLGNDYYLAHIYRTMHWWVAPTHVAVLGDLLGSQWISDDEFSRRADRYWSRVFMKGSRVEDHMTEGGWTETLGADPAWATRVINVAGNHDIGYSGDITAERMARFEAAFGRADFDLRFQLPQPVDTVSSTTPQGPPELRIVVLNSMSLDGPAHDSELQDATYDFINTNLIGTAHPVEDTHSATLLLTHVPLHKPAGVCVDAPMILYRDSGVLREQNHLSPGTSRGVLEGIYGMSSDSNAPMAGHGRNGLILTGHDHEGCDAWHQSGAERQSMADDESPWTASRYNAASQLPPGIREITVRSMMGAYGGNTGLVSAWFDCDSQAWKFEYATCPAGVQHYWWAVHVLDVIVVSLGILGAMAWSLEALHSTVKEKHDVVGKVQRYDTVVTVSTTGMSNGSLRDRRSKVVG